MNQIFSKSIIRMIFASNLYFSNILQIYTVSKQ